MSQAFQTMVLAEFIGCTFFGIHLIVFATNILGLASSHSEISWVSRFKRRRFALVVALLIFVLATINIVLGVSSALPFLTHGCIGIGTGAHKQLGPDWINILKIVCFQLQTDIADFVLIYRCWVVYNKSLRTVIMPTTFYLGLVVTSVMIIVTELKLQGEQTPRLNGNQSLLHLAVGFWVATISINIYASSMIVLRIWRVESESRGKIALASLYVTPHPSRLQAAMKAVLESGLIYTTISIVAFLTHITGSNSIYITTAMDLQIVGIAFNLGLIRVNQRGESNTMMTTNACSTAINFAPTGVSTSNNPLVSSEGADLGLSFTHKPVGPDFQAGVVNDAVRKVTLPMERIDN